MLDGETFIRKYNMVGSTNDILRTNFFYFSAKTNYEIKQGRLVDDTGVVYLRVYPEKLIRFLRFQHVPKSKIISSAVTVTFINLFFVVVFFFCCCFFIAFY